jgi:tRNA dimethylallyltransferase
MKQLDSSRKLLVAVIGPTGSGKTALAAKLAGEFGGELISSDAKQVYKHMDIGTAKEKDLPVPQHLIDLVEPGTKVTVGWYQPLAYAQIDDCLARGVLPILVGGSMLYAESVMNGYDFVTKSQSPRYEVLKIGIAREKDEMRNRLTERTERWFASGLLDEIRGLLASGVSPEWLDSCGLEYRYGTQFVRGEINYEEMIELTDASLRAYVKRQYTWWRRHDNIHWVGSDEEAEMLVKQFLGA